MSAESKSYIYTIKYSVAGSNSRTLWSTNMCSYSTANWQTLKRTDRETITRPDVGDPVGSPYCDTIL